MRLQKLPPDAAVPVWAAGASFVSVTRTPHELSIVREQANVPSDVTIEGGWHALMVDGPLDFNLTGVLASLVGPLAAAGISILAIATYDTNYVVVRARDLSRDRCATRRGPNGDATSRRRSSLRRYLELSSLEHVRPFDGGVDVH